MHVIIGSHIIGVSNGLKFEIDLPRPSGTVSVHSRFLIFSVFLFLFLLPTTPTEKQMPLRELLSDLIHLKSADEDENCM